MLLLVISVIIVEHYPSLEIHRETKSYVDHLELGLLRRSVKTKNPLKGHASDVVEWLHVLFVEMIWMAVPEPNSTIFFDLLHELIRVCLHRLLSEVDALSQGKLILKKYALYLCLPRGHGGLEIEIFIGAHAPLPRNVYLLLRFVYMFDELLGEAVHSTQVV